MTTTKFAPGRLGAAIAAMFAGLLAILMTAPPAHAAAPDPDTIVSAWAQDPLYVESGSPLTGAEQSAIRDSIKGANPPIYVAALPDGTVTSGSAAGELMTKMGTQLKSGGTEKATIALLDGKTLFAASNSLRGGVAGRIANAAVASNSDVASGMQDFVRRVELAESGKTREAVSVGGSRGSEGSSSGGGSGAGVLVGILVLALAGGGGLFLYSRKKKKEREAREAAELAAVKQTVDEDVTKFGEEITALDMDVKMLADGGDHQDDWARALDSYERAKVELEAVKRPDELRGVTTALEEGRYALACVKARVNHLPLPERRSPCFFNPQHGPSVRDVRWAPPGGAVRDVPACAADAEAIERGFEPQTREVMVNGQRRPYYDAGPAYQPYAYGYYGGFGDVMSGMLVGTMLGSMMGGWGMGGYGMGYGAGYQEGVSDAGGDWGGGGDFGGGGDWGGGDFGGGDW